MKPTPTPRQTSDAASSDAAKLLAMSKRGRFEWVERIGIGMVCTHRVTKLVKRVAASALNQDQVKGPRSPKKRKAKGRK